jgi:hypothetical protein
LNPKQDYPMKLQRLLGALCAGLMLVSLPARATEQSSFVTPVTGPMNMATFAGTYLNPGLRAIASCSWGTSAPANGPGGAPIVYQCWANTTTNPVVFSFYDGASWVVYGKLNTLTHVWTPSYQGTDLGTASTATTGASGHAVPFLDISNTWSAIQFGATAAVDTNTTQFATTAFVLGQAASATPLIDGSAAVGTSTRFARGDHVHPTDTTRAPVASPTFTGVPAAPSAAVDTNTTQLATTAYVIGQASASGDGTPAMDGTASRGAGTHFARNDHIHPTDTSRAPLASPALTGTPTATTASPGTNTTQLATTAYADAIAVLKANIASPTFTGTPAAPTATGGTNTTQLATTQFVQSAVTAATTGVASIAGNTGAFTLGNGITNSTNDIRIDTAYGGKKLLATLTASSSATLSDTTSITGSFSTYELVFTGIIPATNGAAPQLQIRSGGVFQSSGYLNGAAIFAGGGTVVAATANTVNITTAFNSTATDATNNPKNATPGMSGFIRLFNPSASQTTNVIVQMGYLDAGNTRAISVNNNGFWNTAAVITGFQFAFNTGAIASGTIEIYGWK